MNGELDKLMTLSVVFQHLIKNPQNYVNSQKEMLIMSVRYGRIYISPSSTGSLSRFCIGTSLSMQSAPVKLVSLISSFVDVYSIRFDVMPVMT